MNKQDAIYIRQRLDKIDNIVILAMMAIQGPMTDGRIEYQTERLSYILKDTARIEMVLDKETGEQ